MMSCARLYVFICWFIMASLAGLTDTKAADNRLVADLSLDEVAITTDFNGESLLLFGAVNDAMDDDIIVIFKGPVRKIASRKKEKVSGIWINRQTINWKNAPSFYHIYSTRPITQILNESAQAELSIGYRHLGITATQKNYSAPQLAVWREALSRNMTEKGLWKKHENTVTIVRGALFRTPVTLPANILPGDYDVRVLHIRDGQLLAEDKTSISVAKKGIGAFIYTIAHDYSIFYGIFAVVFAVCAGWLAAVAFRRT